MSPHQTIIPLKPTQTQVSPFLFLFIVLWKSPSFNFPSFCCLFPEIFLTFFDLINFLIMRSIFFLTAAKRIKTMNHLKQKKHKTAKADKNLNEIAKLIDKILKKL